jgi:hypothetical protein
VQDETARRSEGGNLRVTLYDKLAQRKQHGEKLNMKQITYEVLYQLWWKDECTDEMIADLYDVSKKKVTNLRHKWEVKMPETIIREFQEKFNGTIPDEEEDSQSDVVSADAAAIIRKIHNLNDVELESLRVELARRFPAFSEVKQEVEFLASVERAVRQFEKKIGQ